MSMCFSGQDDDEAYSEYLHDGSMFGAMDREEWQKRRDRAREIVSGISMLKPFDDDEELLEEIRKIRDAEW